MGLPRNHRDIVEEIRRRVARTHAWRERMGSSDDRISFGAPRRNRPDVQGEYSHERIARCDRSEIRAYRLYSAPEGLMLEVDCPLCLELHAHLVDDDFAGGWLQSACGLGTYRILPR